MTQVLGNNKKSHEVRRCTGEGHLKLPIFGVIVVAVLIGAGAAPAQQSEPPAQTATEEARIAFDIPAQPLESAVTAFGFQSGHQVAVDQATLTGRRSNAVRGSFTPAEALNRLLAGTGVTYRLIDENSVTLVAASLGGTNDGPIQLDPITVQGWRISEVEGFRSQNISSATKSNEAIADTPASVNVITQDVLEIQNARSVEDALRNVPGVTPGPNPGNVSVQQEFNIRGFESSLISVNGVERRSTGTLSLANVESVEVLKGPFSVLYGDLSPGGFVNVQTKRPQQEFAAELSAGVDQVLIGRGTVGNGALDVTGPANEDRTFLYRFIVSADGGSSFIDDVDSERYLAAPSLSYIGLGGDLRVDFDFSYLLNDETFQYGVPAFNGRPDTRADYSTFFGSKFSTKKSEDYTAELRADWQITDATSVDAALSWHDYLFDAVFLDPGSLSVAEDNTINRRLGGRDLKSTDKQFEANGIHTLSVGETDWRLLAGGDIRETTVRARDRNISDFDTTNALNPNNSVRLPSRDTIPLTYSQDDTTTAWGLYGQAEVWIFDRLKLLAGFCYDDIEYDVTYQDISVSRSDTKLSPRAAALYKVTPTTSVYGSYTTSFQQEVAFNPDEPPFDPTEGEQFEVGLKQEFFGGRALATLALFDLTQKNLVQPGPTFDTSVQTGEVNSRGIEIEVSGEVIEGLKVIGGYSFIDATVTEATDGTEGNRLPNTPENAASVFVTYDIYDRGDDRLTVGGGVFYQDKRFTSVSNEVELPAFVTVDLVGAYAFTAGSIDLEARVGIKNLFNEEYFVSGDGDGIAFRGQPRTFSAGLRMRF